MNCYHTTTSMKKYSPKPPHQNYTDKKEMHLPTLSECDICVHEVSTQADN